QVLADLMRQARNRQCLQPDGTWPGEYREKDAIAAENHVLDAGYRGDLETHACLKRAYMTGMHKQDLTRGEVLHDQFAGELDPCHSIAANALQEEPAAPEDARTQRLLKADADSDLWGSAEEAVTMNEVLHTLPDLDRHDMTRHFCGKRHLARILHR